MTYRMNLIRSGDQTVRYDPEQTMKAYSAMRTGDPERCGYSYCLNFASQRGTVYPESFRPLLDQLGVDTQKEGEVYECGPDGPLRVYGGWFYFVGEFIERGEYRATDVATGFQYWFADGKALPAPAAEFGANVLAVEFLTKLPWVISEKP